MWEGGGEVREFKPTTTIRVLFLTTRVRSSLLSMIRKNVMACFGMIKDRQPPA